MLTLLTDAHLTILRAAAVHPAALLSPPDRLLGAARSRMAARLVALGLAERVGVAADGPRWLAAEDGSAVGLRLTEAGRDGASAAVARDTAPAGRNALDEAGEDGPSVRVANNGRAPRPCSKAALLLDLLGREDGATLDTLGEALGWQPHTVRAALTRLRQGRAPIERVVNDEGRSRYRLAAAADRPDGAAAEPARTQGGAV